MKKDIAKQTMQAADMTALGQGDDIHELLGGIRLEVAALRVEIIYKVKSSISAVRTSLQAQEQKLKEVEESLTDVDGYVTALETSCAALTKDNEKIRAKCENNLHSWALWERVPIRICERSNEMLVQYIVDCSMDIYRLSLFP